MSIDYVALAAALTIIGVGIAYYFIHDPNKPYFDDDHDDDDSYI